MSYEVSFFARIPQSGNVPTISEIDGLPSWSSLNWKRIVSAPDEYTLACEVSSITPTVRARLAALETNPTELRFVRNGSIVAHGPIISRTVQNGTLTINARGLYYYLNYMVRESAYAVQGRDQALIVKDLIDNAQALTYGNYGLVTTDLTTVGVTRDMTIAAGDFPTLGKRLPDFLDNSNGMDVWVDPTDRHVKRAYPHKGTDRSATVFLDRRAIKDANTSASVAAGQIATEGFATSQQQSDADQVLVGTATNTGLRALFGRVGFAEAFQDVSDTTTLNSHAEELLNDRAGAALSLSPNLTPVTGADVGDFDEGDIVTYSFDDGLGLVTLPLRVRSLAVGVSSDEEQLAVEFV